MTPTRGVSNYSIQSNGSGPRHSSHKYKRQECQPRGEAQMEDARTSTSSQRDIPVSVQKLVYGGKSAIVGTSPKSLNRQHELISSSDKINGARKYRRTSQGLDTHVLQRTSLTAKSLVEEPKHVISGQEEAVGPREGKQPSGSSQTLHNKKSASKSAKKAQANPKYQPEGQAKRKAQVEQALPAE
ncbi:hypothetical protein O181_076954 [Austropuccinia psidii MF-1]|uniref:Uncharacterized protein n=1 Tax=Austropuccinia psidii MF-1 TaxID=1389203 RepID=A0A9Q3FDK6_9BASI|nr:hypothetical protein [Austropuccinia psidii MF-1]